MSTLGVTVSVLIGVILLSLIKPYISWVGNALAERRELTVKLPLIGLAVMFAFAAVKAFKDKCR